MPQKGKEAFNHQIRYGKFSQPDELRKAGRFILTIYTAKGKRALQFSVDEFVNTVVERMNENKLRFDRIGPQYNAEEVKPLFIKFIRHEKIDHTLSVVQAMYAAITDIVLDGSLVFYDKSQINNDVSKISPLKEGKFE